MTIGVSAATTERTTAKGEGLLEVRLPSGKREVNRFFTLAGVAREIGRSRSGVAHYYNRRQFAEVAVLTQPDGSEQPLFSEDQLPAIKELFQ